MKLSPSIEEAMALFRSAASVEAEPIPPPTPDEIRAAEQRLGAALPRSFREFLREAGALHIDFWETLLVGPPLLGPRHIVAANESLRSDPGVSLPAWLIAFAFDGAGGFHAFDTRHAGPEREFPVRYWDHESSFEVNTADHIASHRYFPAWLIEQLQILSG